MQINCFNLYKYHTRCLSFEHIMIHSFKCHYLLKPLFCKIVSIPLKLIFVLYKVTVKPMKEIWLCRNFFLIILKKLYVAFGTSFSFAIICTTGQKLILKNLSRQGGMTSVTVNSWTSDDGFCHSTSGWFSCREQILI